MNFEKFPLSLREAESHYRQKFFSQREFINWKKNYKKTIKQIRTFLGRICRI